MNEKLVYNVAEVARMLDVSRPTVYALLNRGDFPAFRIGSRWLISKAGLESWIAAQCQEGKHYAT